MSYFFFDTSALLKYYVSESGSAYVQAVISNAENAIHIAQMTRVEFSSAIYRRMREGKLTEQDVQNLTLVFTAHQRQNYNVVRLTNPILSQAQSLIQRYPLRAYDSIQLASALNVAFRFDEPLTFVCADVRLLTVAESEGLVPLNPNDHA